MGRSNSNLFVKQQIKKKIITHKKRNEN